MTLKVDHTGSDIRRAGFTLLEVMLAVVIVGTAFTACLSLVNQCISSQERVEHVSTAVMLAKHKMSELEARQYTAAMDTASQSGSYEEPYSLYAWEVEFTPTPLEGVQQVSVSVRWGSKEQNEEVVIDSFMFN